MDPLPEPIHEVSLIYSCGCTWSGMVAHLDGEEPERHAIYPCIPEDCPTCQTQGMCVTRTAMGSAYPEPTDFTDIKPQQRHRYQRMELSA